MRKNGKIEKITNPYGFENATLDSPLIEILIPH